ncbi:murein hydrolase activator EnvC [Novosphingobium sp. TH158]|uniref:murein hydrolase activator EnvC family protein n=1 Tax=Novosphingobium sp. TH158 TaxID=2067455 RepID=UPI000C7E4D6D|nr:peptidoglycan DD-metalloendopeptidase family protein [Novosphingobium sp. TH158]PLK27178.1 metalloendopeptidase [Novosphingobium sp. TH158]
MRTFPVIAALLALGAIGVAATAQQQDLATYDDAGEARQALLQAQREGAAARARAESLEAEAARAGQAADRTAREAAAAAARIQEAQASIAAREADMRLIDRQREDLRAQLAQRQLPVVRLTAALQRLSRRPLALSLLRPGSLRDTVHMRAMLDTMLPQVQQRTAALRSEIDRGKALRDKAEAAVASLKQEQAELGRRRQVLAGLETRQRLDMRQTSGSADREAERALALAEEARDLDSLTARLGEAGALRQQLAQLPGPVMRPANPQAAQFAVAERVQPTAAATGAPGFVMPVQGRLIAGFGASVPGTPRSQGIALATRAGAQAVAPAGGRIAFAGPYRGYGSIIIVDHGNGWTSLITGLAQVDVAVGQSVVGGSPLGIAGPGRPVVSLELRRDGKPVNPLDYARL